MGVEISSLYVTMLLRERIVCMNGLKIKEISRFVEGNEEKTRLIISENGKDTEIILTGNGKLKVAVEA